MFDCICVLRAASIELKRFRLMNPSIQNKRWSQTDTIINKRNKNMSSDKSLIECWDRNQIRENYWLKFAIKENWLKLLIKCWDRKQIGENYWLDVEKNAIDWLLRLKATWWNHWLYADRKQIGENYRLNFES